MISGNCVLANLDLPNEDFIYLIYILFLVRQYGEIRNHGDTEKKGLGKFWSSICCKHLSTEINKNNNQYLRKTVRCSKHQIPNRFFFKFIDVVYCKDHFIVLEDKNRGSRS